MKELKKIMNDIDVQYFVNEDKRMVVAVAKVDINWRIHTHRGFAYCAPEDEFNVKYGKQLSYKRVLKGILLEIRDNYRKQQERTNRELNEIVSKIETISENMYEQTWE